ncbi:MAG: AraC family transcriptional regulator [Candidatus Thiodiazotropha sp. (ex Lucinoma borealis)]|nr:AraC family transcriptional regulator [Candidatus Thiodiazotropha sp. (ex Lucinoma borealis)]
MGDRLVSLLKWFELRARVFQTGPLCRSVNFNTGEGFGYLHVLRTGSMRVETLGQASVDLNQPSLVFYMTPTKHRLIPKHGHTDLVCASFEFGTGLHNPLVRALPDMVLITLAELPGIAATLNNLFREASEDHCGRQAILDRLSEVLIIQLLRELMDQERIEVGLLAGLSDPRLANAINTLHAKLSHTWTLEELASVANMSRARFATVFRETVGITPMAYLSEWRLSAARSLLLKGKSVQTIADLVGYSSASALSRAFAARTGLSPRKWRHKQGMD